MTRSIVARSKLVVTQRIVCAVFGQTTKMLVASVGKEDRSSLGGSESSLGLLVCLSVSDVGLQDAETNETAAELAWRNGVFFSNGNYAIRQLGVLIVSVFMGISKTKTLVFLETWRAV